MAKKVGLFKRIKNLIKEKPYHEELVERLEPFYDRISNYYFNFDGRFGYIIRTNTEAVLLETMILPQGVGNVTGYVGTLIDEYPTLCGKNSEGLLYYRSPYQVGLIELYKSGIEYEKMQYTYKIFDMGEVLASELYKGYCVLYDILWGLNHNEYDEETLTFINKLASKPEMVDYIIKLERIGGDPEVFNALIKQTEEYHTSLFAPIHVLHEQITHKQELQAADKLAQIISWSSTQLLPVEVPEHREVDFSDLGIIGYKKEEE